MICLGYFKLKSVILKKSIPNVIDFNPSVFVTISLIAAEREKKKSPVKTLVSPFTELHGEVGVGQKSNAIQSTYMRQRAVTCPHGRSCLLLLL